MVNIILLIIAPLATKSNQIKQKSQSDRWFTDFIGLVVVSIFFYLAWGFGIPATLPLYLGVTRVILQVVFIVCNILQGLVMVLCYCQKVWRAYNLQNNVENFAPAEDNLYGMTTDEGLLFENPLADQSVTDESLPDYDAVNFEFEQETQISPSYEPEEKVDVKGIDDANDMKEDLLEAFDSNLDDEN